MGRKAEYVGLSVDICPNVIVGDCGSPLLINFLTKAGKEVIHGDPG